MFIPSALISITEKVWNTEISNPHKTYIALKIDKIILKAGGWMDGFKVDELYTMSNYNAFYA